MGLKPKTKPKISHFVRNDKRNTAEPTNLFKGCSKMLEYKTLAIMKNEAFPYAAVMNDELNAALRAVSLSNGRWAFFNSLYKIL